MSKMVSVKRSIWVKGTVEQVWDALTKKEELKRWYTWECELDFRDGGKGYYNHGWGAYSSGIFEEIIEHVSFTLKSGENSRTITTLTPEDEGVRVTIEYQMPNMEDIDYIIENMSFGTDQFMKNLKSMLEDGKDLRPTFWKSWIGIQHISSKEDPIGSKVLSVEKGTPANQAGILSGDIVTHANGKKISSRYDLEQLITLSEPNDSLELIVYRKSESIHVNCVTTEYPVEYRKKVETI